MKMLDLDVKDLNKLGKISREEALEFLTEGMPVVCQTSLRDFHEITKISDLLYVVNLEKEGIYGTLKFFIQ